MDMNGHLSALFVAARAMEAQGDEAFAAGNWRAARYMMQAATQLAGYAYEDCPRDFSINRAELKSYSVDLFEKSERIREHIEQEGMDR